MRALCLIRESLVYRRNSFLAGLRAAGFEVVDYLNDPKPGDLLVIWNRYGPSGEVAKRFEKFGASVAVIENGYLGKSWTGDRWFSMSLGQHSGAGWWRVGGAERWDSIDAELAPWHVGGTDIVILAQRGIGSDEVKSPVAWAQLLQRRIGGRIRAHPGKKDPAISLDDDLRNASAVVTWASTAALKALMMGVPVWYEHPKWIGAEASRPLSEFGGEPKRDDEARLSMFRKMIWAMWREREIEDGSSFRHLLGQH